VKPVPMRLFDKEAFLHDALAQALGTCGGAGRKAAVKLESTLQEVVEVKAHLEGTRTGDDKLGHCLEEAAWALELPPAFDSEWEAHQVAL
jgi:hypothetical protein